jgi:hypothetical protein
MVVSKVGGGAAFGYYYQLFVDLRVVEDFLVVIVGVFFPA